MTKPEHNINNMFKTIIRKSNNEHNTLVHDYRLLFYLSLLVLTLGNVSRTNSFLSPDIEPRTRVNRNIYKRSKNYKLRFKTNDIDSESSNIFLSPEAFNKFLDIKEDDDVKTIVLRDLSHIISDFVVFLDPETSILRSAELFGRILGISSGYMQNPILPPDEVFFQIVTLCISVQLFIKSGLPVIKAHFITTTERDELFYEQLFQKVGITWIQYKSMIAEEILDWVVLEPNTLLVSEKCLETHDKSEDIMYWLLKGDMEVSYESVILQYMERTSGKSINDSTSFGLAGDMRFLFHINQKEIKKENSEGIECADIPKSEYPMATIRTGRKRATMMRIKGNSLLKLMENDERLYKSIKMLLLRSLQRKVSALLLSKSNIDRKIPNSIDKI